MAARSTPITIRNRSDMQFIVSGVGTGLEGGVWSDGGRPEAGTLLLETMDLTIQSESSGFATGTTGTILMTTTIPGSARSSSTGTIPSSVPTGTSSADARRARCLLRRRRGGRRGRGRDHPADSAGPHAVPAERVGMEVLELDVAVGAEHPDQPGPVHDSDRRRVKRYVRRDGLRGGRLFPVGPGDPAADERAAGARRSVIRLHLEPSLRQLPPAGRPAEHLHHLHGDVVPGRVAGVGTLKEAIPRIRADIAAGWPSPIGLIGVISDSIIADLGKHHQVGVCSYQRDGQWITLGIYDPNRPGRDDLQIVIDASSLGSVSLIAQHVDARHLHVLPHRLHLQHAAGARLNAAAEHGARR